MSTEITPTSPVEIFLDATRLTQLWRAAKVFAGSRLIPQHLQGKTEDVLIGLALAHEMGESPLAVLQSIYFVSGRAGWSAQYQIARANRFGPFCGPIRWRVEEGPARQWGGKQGWTAPNLIVTAYGVLDGEEVSVTVDMVTADAEGWTRLDRHGNSKYRTMPAQMLRYRAATWLIRLYCPEVMYGLQTVEELEDVAAAETVIDVRAEPSRPGPKHTSADDALAAAAQLTEDAPQPAEALIQERPEPEVVETPSKAAPRRRKADPRDAILGRISEIEAELADYVDPDQLEAAWGDRGPRQRASAADLRSYERELGSMLDALLAEEF